jgi:hypothetical protein
MSELITIIVVMLVLDAIWLTMNAAYHRSVFAQLQSQPLKIRWIPAVLVYAVIACAIYYFAVLPSATWLDAAGRGSAIGCSMYAVYDLTNYATLMNYPLTYAVGDILWGTTLCGVTALVTKLTQTGVFA